jgi:hypothetical protein
MAGATAPALFFWSRPPDAERPPARAQEGQLKAPHQIFRSRRFRFLNT